MVAPIAAPMRVSQRPRHFAHHARRFGRREGPTRSKSLAERLALDVAHHEEHESARFADAVDRHDVRMRQPGGETDLTQEPVGAHRRGELGPQHLERHHPVVLPVVRQIHRRHAAVAEQVADRVALAQGGGEVRRDRGAHHREITTRLSV
jgi:hypothetical protein